MAVQVTGTNSARTMAQCRARNEPLLRFWKTNRAAVATGLPAVWAALPRRETFNETPWRVDKDLGETARRRPARSGRLRAGAGIRRGDSRGVRSGGLRRPCGWRAACGVRPGDATRTASRSTRACAAL